MDDTSSLEDFNVAPCQYLDVMESVYVMAGWVLYLKGLSSSGFGSWYKQ